MHAPIHPTALGARDTAEIKADTFPACRDSKQVHEKLKKKAVFKKIVK